MIHGVKDISNERAEQIAVYAKQINVFKKEHWYEYFYTNMLAALKAIQRGDTASVLDYMCRNTAFSCKHTEADLQLHTVQRSMHALRIETEKELALLFGYSS